MVLCVIFCNNLFADNDYKVQFTKQINLPNTTIEEIRLFLYNLNFVYSYLMIDHVDFTLDCENIYCSKNIYMKEKDGSDTVLYNYKIIIDDVKGYVQWLSENTKATKWGLFSLYLSTNVIYSYSPDTLDVSVELLFKSQKDLNSYKKYSKNTWEKHFHKEVDNALKVFIYLKENNLLTQSPQEWSRINFSEILK